MKIPKGVNKQFFENEKGQLSMMRLLTYHGARLGRIISMFGLLLLPFELFVFKTGTLSGLSVVALGIALYGAGEGAKALQSGSEHRND